MARSKGVSRRRALQIGAATAALPLVHVRTAGAAGSVSIAFWDHWVPDGNKVMQKQVDAWAEQNKVTVHTDFITSVGNKLLLTAAAEAQAKTGHDVMTFFTWDVQNHANVLANHDDVVKRLTAKYGPMNETVTYLATVKGQWKAVPTSSGLQTKPPCARISWFKKQGLDLQAMYPVKPEHTAQQDGWTYDALLKYAELAQKDGLTFAMGLGSNLNTDGIDQVGAMFRAFGATLVDAKGNITVKSDAVREVLEYSQKLVKFLPADASSFDDASNNRALISGKSALIFNPPSAWAVARRDSPQVAADCWTFSCPAGPKGRYVPMLSFLWGTWSFSQNQSAAKDLIEYLMQREQIEARDNVVLGYDLPPFPSMQDFTVWEKVEPPPGTVYNYPVRPWHNAKPNITASEAPPEIAVQIYNNAIHTSMLARLQQGQTVPQVMDWAQNQLEGFAL
ncbi:MAG: extracellular solute-binding protein [Alphaproteobacteria bacterium]|nr:extracellular solute-binding protein [Alphaproteobacteria bacterium]